MATDRRLGMFEVGEDGRLAPPRSHIDEPLEENDTRAFLLDRSFKVHDLPLLPEGLYEPMNLEEDPVVQQIRNRLVQDYSLSRTQTIAMPSKEITSQFDTYEIGGQR